MSVLLCVLKELRHQRTAAGGQEHSLMSEFPRTYTAKQLSAILQMPVCEVYRDGASQIIPGRIRVGGRTRWNAEIVDAWLRGECI